MPHPQTGLKVNTVSKPTGTTVYEFDADVRIIGAGIASISAAIESGTPADQVPTTSPAAHDVDPAWPRERLTANLD